MPELLSAPIQASDMCQMWRIGARSGAGSRTNLFFMSEDGARLFALRAAGTVRRADTQG